MRTQTKTYNIYNYKDLLQNEELKQIVLDKQAYINVDLTDWQDYIIEDWIEKLENIGFINPEINYTGFYSQGDGASFTCKEINIQQVAQQLNIFTNRELNILKALQDNGYIEAAIKRYNYHYSHEKSIACEYYDGDMKADWKYLQTIVNKFFNNIDNFIIELSLSIYKDLQNEYEYLTSEQAILDTIEANDYEFYETGDLV